MCGIDSLSRATKDIPNTHSWKPINVMSSRFVFFSLYGVEFINLIANGENLAYVCTGQLRATRHLLSSVTSFPPNPRPCNLTPVLPFNEIALKLAISTLAFGMNSLFPVYRSSSGAGGGVEDE